MTRSTFSSRWLFTLFCWCCHWRHKWTPDRSGCFKATWIKDTKASSCCWHLDCRADSSDQVRLPLPPWLAHPPRAYAFAMSSGVFIRRTWVLPVVQRQMHNSGAFKPVIFSRCLYLHIHTLVYVNIYMYIYVYTHLQLYLSKSIPMWSPATDLGDIQRCLL